MNLALSLYELKLELELRVLFFFFGLNFLEWLQLFSCSFAQLSVVCLMLCRDDVGVCF